jgi:hypothetical protein
MRWISSSTTFPAAMIFCPSAWSQETMNWILWDHRPKQIFPALSCFC